MLYYKSRTQINSKRGEQKYGYGNWSHDTSTGIGCILDLKWDGSIEKGIRIYDLGAYHTAFTLITGLIIAGIIIIHFARETHCSQLRQ